MSESVVDPAHAKILTLHIAGATPRERGLARASAAAQRIRATARGYGRLFDQLGISEREQKRACRTTLEALKDWDPDQAEELAGVATGSGLNIPEIMLTAARTEILTLARGGENTTGEAVASECSTLGLQRPGSSLVAQTWDWYPEFAECWHAQRVEPLADAGAASHGTASGAAMAEAGELAYAGLSEFGMLGKIGMNEAGLGVDLNILEHLDDSATGVPLHAVLTRILARARTVDDALAIIESAPTTASSLITVTTPDRVAMVELTPGGCTVLEPGEPGVKPAGGATDTAARSAGSSTAESATWFCHTNDFLHAEFAAKQEPRRIAGNSPERFAVLDERTEAATASPVEVPDGDGAAPQAGSSGQAAGDLPRTAEDLLPWLTTDPADNLISQLPDPGAELGERSATLATVRMDPAARTIRVSPGIPQAAAKETIEFTL